MEDLELGLAHVGATVSDRITGKGCTELWARSTSNTFRKGVARRALSGCMQENFKIRSKFVQNSKKDVDLRRLLQKIVQNSKKDVYFKKLFKN